MNIEELIGKTLHTVYKHRGGDGDELIFVDSNADMYKLFHYQNCCESVHLSDICGELDDLVGSPIIQAMESSNDEQSDGLLKWTFYRIATAKGSVVLTWRGSSNGYYSVNVSFEKIEDN